MAIGNAAGAPAARRLDWRVVRRGSATVLAIAVPCGLIIALVHGNDASGQESNLWTLAAVVVVLVAPFAGGAVAGSVEPRTPLMHAAVAVALPATLFLVVRAVAGLVKGSLSAAQGLTFLLYLAVFTGSGMLGGYLSLRRHARSG